MNTYLNKKTILIFSLVFILVVLTVSLLAYNKNEENNEELEEYLIENPENPNTEKLRKIVEEDIGNGYKTVSNFVDGYRITVPSNWVANKTVSRAGELKIVLPVSAADIKEEQAGIDTGFLLKINYFENQEGLELVNWLARSKEAQEFFLKNSGFDPVETQKHRAFKASHPVYDGVEAVEDSLAIDYVFQGKNRAVYIVSCASLTQNYTELVAQCEQQVQTFDIIE